MTLFKRIATLFMAALLLTALGCASTSERSSTGEYIDDSVITTKVKAAIFKEADLKIFEINVETRQNVVQLSGVVSTYADKNRATNVALAVPGVLSVTNDLMLK